MAWLPRRVTRRRFGALVATSLVASGCAASGPAAPSGAPPVPARGKWLITQNGNFVLFDLATRQETQLSHFSGALASSPALSPDRKLIVYTYYQLPNDPNNLGGSDLYVMNADGSNPRLVRSHGQPNASFVDPCWSADGAAIYASLRAPIMVGGQAKGTSMTIVRVPLDGGEPSSIADGESPTASPDGKLLAFITTDKSGATHLWVGAPDGSNTQEPLASRGFTLLQEPRFAPDGKRIAFAAVGGPAKASRSRRGAPNPLLALALSEIAEADGTPMDIWSVQADGTDLRRLTSTQDHSPTVAWSPDGQWLAEAGELSLTLVSASAAPAQQLSSNAKATGVVWL